MKRISLTLITTLFLSLGTNLFAQTPDEMVKTFFDEYQTKGVIVSLDNLYSTNPWISANSDAVKNLKTQLGAVNEDLVGKFRGYELIVHKELAGSFVLMSYMVKFDRQPIRFTFEFYKPAENWITFAFMYDDTIDEDIEEAAKNQIVKNLTGGQH